MTVVAFAGGKTAGHFHPARNIAEALVEIGRLGGCAGAGSGGVGAVSPFFVGAEGGIEARELPRLGYDHALFPLRGLTHPFPRGGSPGGAFAALGVPAMRRVLRAWAENVRAMWLLCRAAGRLLVEFRRRGVAAVVLTGGYAAAPAGVAGALLRLPLVLQEQNVHVGKTTRLMARCAAQIHVAYPEAAASLPRSARPKALGTGNPIRPLPAPERRDEAVARVALGLPAAGRVVLIVGGSQGAQALNRAALEGLPDAVPGDCCVLWITGRGHYEHVRDAVAAKPGADERVRLHPYLKPEAMYQALSAADLAVARAGAMATSEFLAWGLPSILVPLPTAAADHQARNAAVLELAGAAVALPERDLAGGEQGAARLWGAVAELLAAPARLERMSRAALERARPSAAADVARAVASLLPPASGACARASSP